MADVPAKSNVHWTTTYISSPVERQRGTQLMDIGDKMISHFLIIGVFSRTSDDPEWRHVPTQMTSSESFVETMVQNWMVQ